MRRLGMPVSDDTILRQLKRDAARAHRDDTIRVVGIDDWSWRRSWRYGTMIVDLERRSVVDSPDTRSGHRPCDLAGSRSCSLPEAAKHVDDQPGEKGRCLETGLA
jgi:transposase